MLAIINPAAGGGKALEKWFAIATRLRESLGSFTTFIPDREEQFHDRIQQLLADGHRRVIAGGGDGTVNAVLSAVLDHAESCSCAPIAVGAVGLGSSNDFHKPFRSTLDGIPCRLDFGDHRAHDVGLLKYEDPYGVVRSRYWFANASLGLAADANDYFNHPDCPLRWLKRSIPSAAISFAALRTMLTNRPRTLWLSIDDLHSAWEPTRNIGFVKNPHFAGGLHYDSPHETASGTFHVHHLGAVSRLELLRTLVRLSQGRFRGGAGARSWAAQEATVFAGDGVLSVEFDGEVVNARRVSFSILPEKVSVCS